MATELVVWDIDNVWYKDISTSHAARASRNDYRPYLKDMVETKGWFTYDHVKLWEEKTGRKVDSTGSLADMLTHSCTK